MSNNLAITQLATNQASPEVPINDAMGAFDAAVTEILTIDLSLANFLMTNLQYRNSILFRIINATTVGRNVQIPQIKRGWVIFESDVANTQSFTIVRGTTSVACVPGRTYLVYTDGTANGLAVRDIGGLSEPHDLHVFLPGTMTAAQLLYRLETVRPFTLPINLAGSFVSATVAATASTTITLKKNGTSIGTAVFGIGSPTATLTFTVAVSFAITDILTIEGPAVADATLANVSLDLLGTR